MRVGVHRMARDLERRVVAPVYKSYGERRVASVLDAYGIPFEYERATLVDDHGKSRLWYPDFWLRDAAVAVEYFGLAGVPEYDRMIEKKTGVYADNGISMLPVYRHQLGRELPEYLVGGVRKTLFQRYRRLCAGYRRSQSGSRKPY